MQRSWNSLVFLSGLLLSQTLVILCPSRPSLLIGPCLLGYIILQDLPSVPQSDFVEW
jgi:hypothetical protein